MVFMKKNINICHIKKDILSFLYEGIHTHVWWPVYETYFRFTTIDHSLQILNSHTDHIDKVKHMNVIIHLRVKSLCFLCILDAW